MRSNENKPVKYISQQPELEDWIRDFASHLRTHPEKNVVVYPESFAHGYARVAEIEAGVSYRIVDYQLNVDFLFERLPSEDFYLILYYYEYRQCRQLQLKINNKMVVNSNESNYSTLLMTNSRVLQQLTVTSGTLVRGLTIQITENWLREKITASRNLNFSMLHRQDVFQRIITPKGRQLLKEIFERSMQSAIPELYRNVRVLRLLEMFLEGIIKNGLKAHTFPSSAKDVYNVLQVEEYLKANSREGFPHIGELAKMALMSPSKLKTVFKRAFGQSLFEYYQRNRMHEARQLLKSGEHPVGEVSKLMGYHNASNFAAAFKKEFGMYPHDIGKM